MKKILIIVATVIVALALTPIVGNKVIESKLDENINKLSSNGLEIKNQKTDSGYLNTSKHYEFAVKDSQKFINYLSELLNQQIPSYGDSFFKDSVVGVDLKFSNVPVLKTTSIDIYPISLSEKIMQDIKNEDTDFANFIQSFLAKKGLSYHVDYDILSQDFKGYIKDVKESYAYKADSKIDFELTGSTFFGNGNLISPNFLDSNTKKIYTYFSSSSDEVKISLNNMSTSLKFESITSYTSSLDFNSLDIDIQSKNKNDSKIDIKNILFDFSSSTDGTKAKFSSKSSFEKFDITTKNESIYMKNFNFDTTLDGIDKDSYEELNVLLRKSSNLNDNTLSLKMQKLIEKLFLKGFELNIKDISIENIRLNKNDLGTSSLKSNVKLPQNAVTSKVRPMELINKIDIDMLINISKPMFKVITNSTPILAISQGYAKDNGNSLVYDLKVKDGSVTVNGKKVK